MFDSLDWVQMTGRGVRSKHMAFMRLVTVIAVAGFTLAPIRLHASATECVFNSHAYSADTYRKRQGVAYVKWNDSTAQAVIVSRTGRLIAVHHWSCMHIGAEAQMYLDSKDKSLDVSAAMQELARIVLSSKEARRVLPLIAGHNFTRDGSDRLDIPSEGYDEFFVSTQSLGPVLLLTLRYYRE